MTSRIAIIPARGGSKRIPNKNIRDFCGKPMISYILRAARDSGLFDVIHVSTESSGIRDVVEGLGFPVDFMRPEALADDYTPIMPVLRHVLESYVSQGKHFGQVWILMACAPLVEMRDLQQAAECFDSAGGREPLLAVAEFPAPVERSFRRGNDGRLTPVQPEMFPVRSQDLDRKYYDAGSFAVFPAESVFQSKGAGSGFGFVSYVLPRWKAIDIDEEADWALAEVMYQVAQKRVGW